MIWQDLAMLAAQSFMFVMLMPTLFDRSRWPHPATAAGTSAALVVMCITLSTLDLMKSAIVVALLALAWGRMAWR